MFLAYFGVVLEKNCTRGDIFLITQIFQPPWTRSTSHYTWSFFLFCRLLIVTRRVSI